MKRFRFRLQRMLELSRKKEEAARRHLAGTLAELTRAEDEERAAWGRLRRQSTAFLQTAAAAGVNPRLLQAYQGHIVLLEARRRVAVELREKIERDVESARLALLETRRDVLALDKARERALETWKSEALREELQTMEETAAYRARIKEDRR
ncbi:MAG TPA: hypothetical protein ENK43_11235 [Planctomycetes bacterium]|nr:hypothetical protein [Planctomycetota bacterium]